MKLSNHIHFPFRLKTHSDIVTNLFRVFPMQEFHTTDGFDRKVVAVGKYGDLKQQYTNIHNMSLDDDDEAVVYLAKHRDDKRPSHESWGSSSYYVIALKYFLQHIDKTADIVGTESPYKTYPAWEFYTHMKPYQVWYYPTAPMVWNYLYLGAIPEVNLKFENIHDAVWGHEGMSPDWVQNELSAQGVQDGAWMPKKSGEITLVSTDWRRPKRMSARVPMRDAGKVQIPNDELEKVQALYDAGNKEESSLLLSELAIKYRLTNWQVHHLVIGISRPKEERDSIRQEYEEYEKSKSGHQSSQSSPIRFADIIGVPQPFGKGSRVELLYTNFLLSLDKGSLGTVESLLPENKAISVVWDSKPHSGALWTRVEEVKPLVQHTAANEQPAVEPTANAPQQQLIANSMGDFSNMVSPNQVWQSQSGNFLHLQPNFAVTAKDNNRIVMTGVQWRTADNQQLTPSQPNTLIASDFPFTLRRDLMAVTGGLRFADIVDSFRELGLSEPNEGFAIGDTVDVEPELGDEFDSFQGTIVQVPHETGRDYFGVRDSENNVWEVETTQMHKTAARPTHQGEYTWEQFKRMARAGQIWQTNNSLIRVDRLLENAPTRRQSRFIRFKGAWTGYGPRSLRALMPQKNGKFLNSTAPWLISRMYEPFLLIREGVFEGLSEDIAQSVPPAEDNAQPEASTPMSGKPQEYPELELEGGDGQIHGHGHRHGVHVKFSDIVSQPSQIEPVKAQANAAYQNLAGFLQNGHFHENEDQLAFNIKYHRVTIPEHVREALSEDNIQAHVDDQTRMELESFISDLKTTYPWITDYEISGRSGGWLQLHVDMSQFGTPYAETVWEVLWQREPDLNSTVELMVEQEEEPEFRLWAGLASAAEAMDTAFDEVDTKVQVAKKAFVQQLESEQFWAPYI